MPKQVSGRARILTNNSEEALPKAFEGMSNEALYGSRDRASETSRPRSSQARRRSSGESSPSHNTSQNKGWALTQNSPQNKRGMWQSMRRGSEVKTSFMECPKDQLLALLESEAAETTMANALSMFRQDLSGSTHDATSNKKITFKGAAKKVILTRRLFRENGQKQLWAASRSRNQTMEWYKCTFHLDSRVLRSARNFVFIWSLVDICMMMLTAVGFHGCSAKCLENGGTYSTESMSLRGHLGPIFNVIRIVCGLLSDCFQIAYLFINFRTVRSRSNFGKKNSQDDRSVAFHYLKSAFLQDFICCAPFYWYKHTQTRTHIQTNARTQ